MTRPGAVRLLLLGDGFAAFGMWIDFLAILTLAAYQFRVTPYEMAIVSGAGLLPGMLLARGIGRLCDQRDPKQLLLVSIALRVAATIVLLLCQSFPLFLLMVALRSVFTTVAGPAINVIAVRSIDATARPRFYAVLNVLNSSAKVLAPAIGTVSASLGSEALALAMSAACALAALALFALLPAVPPARAADTADAADAAPATAPPAPAAPSLLPLLWIACTAAFSVFMVNNLVPVVLQRAGLDKALLGVLVSCAGAGNILAGLWLARRTAAAQMQGRALEAVVPALLQAAGFGAIGLLLWGWPAQVPVLLPLLFFAIGTVSARFSIALNVHMSTHHAAAIGSVSGTLQAWQNGMIFGAPLAGAWLLDHWGAPALFGVATLLPLLSFALLGWLSSVAGPVRRAVHRPAG